MSGLGMIQWIFGVFCLVTFILGALTLHTTQGSLHHLKTVQQAKAMSMRIASAVPAAPREAVSRTAPQVPGATAPRGRTAEATGEGLEPLDVVLVGTAVERNPDHSLAIMEDRSTGGRRTYRRGDMVRGRRLTVIERGYVILVAGEQQERLDLEAARLDGQAPSGDSQVDYQAWEPVTRRIFEDSDVLRAESAETLKAAITPISETERAVKRQLVWDALDGNPLRVLREAMLAPALRGGRLVGVVLTRVPDDGVFQHSGFRSGDVIRSVNGQPVTSPAIVLQLPSALLQDSLVTVQIERDGRPLTLTYHLQ